MTRIEILHTSLLACSLLAAASLVVAEEELPELPENRGAIASNTYFEVLADEMLSAQYVASVGEILGKEFSRTLPAAGSVRRPVLVNLVPAKDLDEAERFKTRIYRSGQVNVSISWGPATTRETVERALAQGLLTYCSGVYAKNGVNVPLWLELALQQVARVQAVPSYTRFLAEQVVDGSPKKLAEIVALEHGEEVDGETRAYAYWLLKFLEREGRRQAKVENFLIRLLGGEAPLVAMNAAYGENLRSAADAEIWWMVGLKELIRTRGSPMMSPVDSRRRVKELSRFSFKVDGRDSRVFAEDLWEHRKSARLQNELLRRRQMISLELGGIHSFYHNVLLSLDRAFDAVLSAEEEDYREAILAFQHDLRAGDELAEDATSVLDDLSAELES